MKKRKIVRYGLVIILAFIVFWGGSVFIGNYHYRKMIGAADKIELRFSIVPGASVFHNMATLTNSNDIKLLAKSIKFRGLWVPWDALIGNTYTIGVIKNGISKDVVIRGHSCIRKGIFTAAISPDAIKMIKTLVIKNNGRLPDRELMKELSDRAGKLSEER